MGTRHSRALAQSLPSTRIHNLSHRCEPLLHIATSTGQFVSAPKQPEFARSGQLYGESNVVAVVPKRELGYLLRLKVFKFFLVFFLVFLQVEY